MDIKNQREINTMKTILITGGCGFIGSNFIDYLFEQEANVRVINFDLLTYAANQENLAQYEQDSRYTFIKGDIADIDAVKKVFEEHNIDWVVNFAAETHVDNSISSPGVFVKTNVLGTQNLLDAAKNHWQIGKDEAGYPTYKSDVKYLQISTDEVYGTLGKEGYFHETTPLAPNSPYSSSKAGADLLVRAYHMTYHLPVNITRCSNNYGPKQFPEKLIPLMILKALDNQLLPVYGDGMQIRDWIHVKDHCAAILLVLQKGVLGEVYNVGGGNERANIDIVRAILKALGKDETLINYVQDRLGHDRRYAIDSTKIENELGYKGRFDFEEGLIDTIRWYS